MQKRTITQLESWAGVADLNWQSLGWKGKRKRGEKVCWSNWHDSAFEDLAVSAGVGESAQVGVPDCIIINVKYK